MSERADLLSPPRGRKTQPSAPRLAPETPRPKAWERTLSPAARRVLREPLFHFIVIGLVIFAAGLAYRRETSLYRIEITPARTAEVARAYALQFGAPPDAPTLRGLLQRDLQDEMLYRQGIALKLDKDDQIVRRRVIQKMQFLMQDLAPPAEPTPAALQAYYEAHAARYVTPARATFTHIYFSPDRGGDAAARRRAQAVLRTLSDGVTRAQQRGDSFPDLYDYSAFEPEQAVRLFGDTPFSHAVFTAPVGHWSGPYRSGYGWHLLYVEARQPPATPALSEMAVRVRSDYLQDEQGAQNGQALQALARRFTVVQGNRGRAP
jgi:hypothetical protein